MQFSPFPAIRYSDPTSSNEVEGVLDLEGVIAPFLAAANPSEYADFFEYLNPYNTYHLLTDKADAMWDKWLKEGVLERDGAPKLYCYYIGYRDNENRLHQVAGVIGELKGVTAADNNGPADVVPVLATIDAPGFSELLAPNLVTANGVPLARATDSAGIHHRLWAIEQQGIISTIQEAVEKAWADNKLNASEELFSRTDGTRMAFISETMTTETLPALGLTFRERKQNAGNSENTGN